MSTHRPSAPALALLLLPCLAASAAVPPWRTADPGGLSEGWSGSPSERVTAQRAIERVFWEHREWPASNRASKPPLEELVAEGTLARKAEDALRMSAALEDLYQRALSPAELQAEVDRMARQSRQPGTLRQIFEALGDDPERIAECLARPGLAESALRRGYAGDSRFHGALRQRTESERASWATSGMVPPGADYSEIVWVRRTPGGSEATPSEGGAGEGIRLGPEEWERLTADICRTFEAPDTAFPGKAQPTLEDLPLGAPSPLGEDEERFFALVLLRREEGRLTLGVARWPKTPFRTWWDENRLRFPAIALSPGGYPYRLPPVEAAPCADGSWSRTAGGPDICVGHSAVWTGSEMIVWGGNSYNGNTSSGGRYNPATDTWRDTDMGGAPVPRTGHTGVWTGARFLVWGGTGKSSADFLDTGGMYDPVSDSWVTTSNLGAPAPRSGHTAVWTGTRMVVWGGQGATGYLNTGGVYDPDTGAWAPTSTSGAPSGRYKHTAVWATERGVMIVWGGMNAATGLDTGSRFDPSADSWAATSISSVASPRFEHTAVWTGSEMIVWGGKDPSWAALNSGGRYNPATNVWNAVNTTGGPGLSVGHAAVWTGSRMLIWGGGSYYTPGAGSQYNPGTNSWTAMTTANSPHGRSYPSAVWTGTEMIIWGGTTFSSNVAFDGGRYNPASDSWTVFDTPGLPLPRSFPTAVWTGAEMIVWGGSQDSSWMNTGGRYTPATDSWAATSTGTNCPSNRYLHAAVWTGREMVIWGGGWDPLGSGGRYDPVADTWKSTNLAGAPSARKSHTAVWTGDRMLVWGGYGCANPPICLTLGYLNNGGAYDPEADAWSAVATTGAPSGRTDHAAVWSGSKMIVWGGYNGSSFLASGGVYDPSAFAWSPTSSSGSPGPRGDHAAVWSGKAMIIWGGLGGGYENSGGLYYPDADLWVPTSITGAPVARAFHTAVWAREEMIVWGGTSGSCPLEGGRYNPAMDAWASTGTHGAPFGRYGNTAVWAGSEMIVWGGAGMHRTRTGGRFCACLSAPDPAASPDPSDGAAACPTTALRWAGADGASVYDVYLDGDLVCGGTPARTCAPPLSGGAHTWSVHAINGCGTSPGPEWKVYIDVTPPDTSGWDTLRVGGGTIVSLGWGAVAGATGYYAYRDTVADSEWGAGQRISGRLTGTAFDDTPPEGMLYFYQAKAADDCDNEGR